MRGKRYWFAGITVIFSLAAQPDTSRGLSVPDTITLNTNGKLYQSFQFNHAKHIKLTKECSDCHHHTTGTLVQDPNCLRCHRNSGETKVVACKGCHFADPFTADAIKGKDPKLYHHDKPGLKAALHRVCIDCHSKAKGPTGCVDCHRRTKEGEAFYNSGEFAPKGKPAKGGH